MTMLITSIISFHTISTCRIVHPCIRPQASCYNDCKITTVRDTVRGLQFSSNPLPSNACLFHSKNELEKQNFNPLHQTYFKHRKQRSSCERTRNRSNIGKIITRPRHFFSCYLISFLICLLRTFAPKTFPRTDFFKTCHAER